MELNMQGFFFQGRDQHLNLQNLWTQPAKDEEKD